MRIIKNRKLISIILLAVILIVFAITIGSLSVLQENNVKSPGVSPVADYTINAPVRDSNTIKWVDVNSHSDAWVNVQYPSKIYLDKGKGESLDSVGYYFYADNSYGNNLSRRIHYINITFGYCDGSYNGKAVSEAWANENWYTFMKLFDYGLTYESVNNIWGFTGNNTTNTKGLTGVSEFGVGASSNASFQWKYKMTGGIKSDTKVGTYKYTSVPNSMSDVTTTYLSRDLKGNYGETAGFKYDREGSREMDGVNTSFTNGMDIDIYIYDKTVLGQKVADFKQRIANDQAILNKINGGDSAYKHAENFISDIEDNILKKREVTPEQVTAAENQIDAYKYQINVPSISTGKVYDANDFNISNVFSGYDSKYFDLQLLDKSGNSANLVNVGEYKIKLTLKNTVDNKVFVWADGSGNATKEYSYNITPNTFTATVADQTHKYKVSDYDVGLQVTYNNHIREDINPINFALSLEQGNFAENLKTISLSEVNDYTIYYKMTSTNHNDVTGSFSVRIEKADIVLYLNKITCTYGESSLPNSDEIYETMFDWDKINIFDAEDNQGKKDYIIGNIEKGIDGVLSQVAIAKDGNPIVEEGIYPDAGSYNLFISRNSAYESKANITFAKDGETTMDAGAYVVLQCPIRVSWTRQTNMWYDNKAGKRPTAAIIGDVNNANVSVAIVGDGIGFDNNPIPLFGEAKEAIYAGRYTAQAVCDNDNYIIEEDCLEEEFTILQRKINVTVKDRGRTYAYSMTAQGVWNNYIDLFKANSNNEIYTLSLDDSISDGGEALADNDLAYNVFEILLNDAEYTDGSESARYYKVGSYTLEPSLLATDTARSYKFIDAVSGTFTVRNADINFTLPDLTKLVFKGVAQNVVVDKNDSRITFKGWENEHRDEVKLYFAESEEEAATSVREDFIQVTNASTYTIWCRITAPNHNDLIKQLSIEVEKSTIYIDVTGQTSVFTYGNGVPTSDELKTILGINLYWSTDSDKNEELKIADMDSRIVYNVLKGSEVGRYNTGDKIIVGKYSVHHALATGELSDNYSFVYVKNELNVTKDIEAFTVSQKELRVDWTQDGAGWSFDQTEQKWKFTYSNAVPSISVKALAEDVVWNDQIRLSTSVSGKAVDNYTATTNLTVDINKSNYILTGNTFDFDIVPLDVYINVNAIQREFGKVQQNRPLGKDMPLLAAGSEGAIWNYANGYSSRFFGDDYTNFCFISDAITADGNCKDVGSYDIAITTIEGASGEITKNYNVIITNIDEAKFTIIAVNIPYSGIKFNINDNDEDSAKIITKEQIRQLISIDGFKGVNRNEFNIKITELKDNNTPSEAFISGDQISAALKDVGVYYFSLRIEHKNFNTLNYEVEVNLYNEWISVIINEKIKVTYGDEMCDSDALYELLKGKIDIIGMGSLSADEALEQLKGMIEIYVGSNNNKITFNGPVGNYSIYFDQSTNNTSGENEKKFRFLPKEGGTITSNIDVYVVEAKELEMDWAEDMNIDEVYGEHSENSPSHECTKRLILVDGEPNSNIRVTAKYEKFENSSWVVVNGHAKDAGRYRVTITGINSDNYFVVENKLVKEFNITKKAVEISLKNRDNLVYGKESTTKAGMINYLNNIPNGFVPYDLISGEFIDDVSTIFSYKLNATLADGLNYYDAGNYNIGIDVISNNYAITVSNFGNLVVENATIVYNRAQFVPQVYTGNDIHIVVNKEQYSLSGDITEATGIQYKIKGSSNFTNDLYVSDVGTYEIIIKITAENHNDYITDENNAIKFEVKPVHVEISMQQINKVYGDTLDELLSQEGVDYFDEWLVKKCNITLFTYTLDDGGNKVEVEVNIDRLKQDFKFKVIQNEQGGSEQIIVGKNNVGTYTVTHDTTGDYAAKMKNYSVDYYKAEGAAHRCNYDAYKIVRRQVSVLWETENSTEKDGTIIFEYNNATGPSITAKVKEVDKDDLTTIPVVFKPENTMRIKSNALNVGKYYAEVVDGDGFDLNSFQKNYELLDRTFNFTIVQKKITVTITIPSCVYGSEQSLIGGAIDLNGKITVEGEDLNTIAPYIKLDIINPSNTGDRYYAVGSYETNGVCSSENYDVDFVTNEFVVTNAQIGISISNYDLKYSGNKSGYIVDVKSSLKSDNGYTIKGDMTWDSVQILYEQGDGSYVEAMPVIKGVISGKVIKCKAVLANHEDKLFTITYNIAPADILINWENNTASSVYGDELLSSAEILAKTGATVDESSDLQVNLEELITFVVLDTELNAIGKVGVGSYKIGYTFIDDADKNYYNIRFNRESYYSVNAKELTCNWDYTDSLVYNAEEQTILANIVGVLAGDTIDIQYSGNKYTNAGDYTATIAISGNPNYTVANLAELEWSISPKDVSVDWSGNEFTYNGESQHPIAIVKADDLLGDDTCAIKVLGGKVNVGSSYTATATSLNSNYKVANNATYSFVIKPKTITFSWANEQIVYNGKEQAPRAVAIGLVKDDSVEFVVEGAKVNAGNGYIAKVTGIKNNDNYVIASGTMENTKEFNIEKAKNEFVNMDNLPEVLEQLPWTDGSQPLSKFGDVSVKYFSDEECTQEVTDIAKVGKGKYWVVVSVAGTDNYDAISKTIEVEITGSGNLIAVIAGCAAGGLLLIVAIVVTIILVTKKKKSAR